MSEGIRVESLIQEKLKYDPETGIVSCRKTGKRRGWNVTRNKGTLKYRMVQIRHGGKRYAYMEHQVITVLMTGAFAPKGMETDHINGNGRDNRWSNLRVVTPQVNRWNMGSHRNSKYKYKYIHWHAKCDRVQVKIRDKYVGIYKTVKEAVAARNRWLVENNEELRPCVP